MIRLLPILLVFVLCVPARAMDVTVRVSSFKVDVLLQYSAEHILDGDPTTAWAGGSVSSGEGQWVEFDFGVPVALSRLGIFNGHQGEGQFEKFRRIRSGRIVYPDGSESKFWLRDEPGEQVVDCPVKMTKSIRIVVDEVFPEGVPLARQKLAVSEVKFYLTNTLPKVGAQTDAEVKKKAPASTAEALADDVPDEMKELLRAYYVKQTSLADDFHMLFAPHVRDKHDFQFEIFKEVQRQRGTYRKLRTAEVNTNNLRFEKVFIQEDVAEIRVFGSYHVKVANLDKDLEEDSSFILMKGDEGWRISELDGEQ